MTLPNLRSALGEPMLSPLASRDGSDGGGFVGDKDVVMLKAVQYESLDSAGAGCDGLSVLASQDMSEGCIPMASWATRAGPRKLIYHDPKTTTAAIVTCGGLCPGLNDIIQNIVYMLADYGVPEEQILGVRYGLRGFIDRKLPPIPLHRAEVDGIQLKGGTILGTSRGNAQIHEIVKRLDLWGVNMLFVLGGNGGNAAAEAIHEECVRENVLCSVVAVPKSIDNDILVIDKTFGFETAVEEAQRAILAAKVEASSAYRGVGIVRLMGRQVRLVRRRNGMI
jgi:6-phosphofructokinase 1